MPVPNANGFASQWNICFILCIIFPDCGGLLKSPTGFLSSPTTSSLAPNTNYPNDKVCFWVLEAPTVKSMELAFNEFDLGACAPNAKDWLEVSTGLTDMLDQ